jgi:hypothetical protein
MRVSEHRRECAGLEWQAWLTSAEGHASIGP